VQAQARVRNSQIALIVLTAVTALIHFERAIQDPDIRILFIMNGLGYFALLAAFYLPRFQRFHNAVRWTFIAYTATPFCFTSCGLLSAAR
jgi:hypothetical protein